MAFGKNMDQKKHIVEKQFQLNINNLICDFLINTENQQQISFLNLLQNKSVSLVFINKHRRRYSAELLMMAYIVHATSPRACERLIEQVIILPSTKTLENITLNLNSKTGLDDEQYLRLRFSQLNAFDRNVIIMIDEIYLSKHIEASGGQLFGLTENCQIATTALCFVIKSLSSGYQDMVRIVPVKNLNILSK